MYVCIDIVKKKSKKFRERKTSLENLNIKILLMILHRERKISLENLNIKILLMILHLRYWDMVPTIILRVLNVILKTSREVGNIL